MKLVFLEIANGVYALDQIRKMANKKGNPCRLIKNPICCGKIVVTAYKDLKYADRQHEPISLFYDVQDVLSGKKPKNLVDRSRKIGF